MDLPEKVRWPSDAELKNTITIRVIFHAITQDINAAIFLSQLHYWTSKTKNIDKWVYKTINELQKEIFLTGYQQRRARERLLKLGLIEEKRMGMPPKMYFRLRLYSEDGTTNQETQQPEVNKVNINSEETLQMNLKELAHNSEETSCRTIKILDEDPQTTLVHSNIDKITTKNTSEITTMSSFKDAAPLPFDAEPANIIFSHWKNVMNHPNSKMDKKRKQLISQVLKDGYSVEEICNAISGCAITPHNIGDNDKGQRFDGLHIILKNADQIDRFIANYHYPPKKRTKFTQALQNSLDAGQRWLMANKKEG